MIPVLRSIDGLLNRFDELSQRHASFVSKFETSFTDIENPLRDVTRDEEERRKTSESILNASMENDDQMGSFGTIEDFNRRITKSRSHNRPPSYSSNDTNSLFNRIPSRSSFATTESAPPLYISALTTKQVIVKPRNVQSIASISSENLIEPKNRFTTKIKTKPLPQNLHKTDQYGRNVITTFTVETVNRLSRPRTYNKSPGEKVSSKRAHRRAKTYQNIKKEPADASMTPVPTVPSVTSLPLPPTMESPKIKRTHPTIIKSSSKKLKVDNKIATDNSKRIPMSNYPRPTIVLAPPPTISLTFPMQPELKSSRVVVLPKTATTQKTINIFSKKGSSMPPRRLLNLMTASGFFS
ncbi:unnamed protein product [Rotaria magnacalcarata]|uniref:Uncharacterized protein n=3 Tax=Rotaria magnacalcarata TaxID=392030 RepID=A0A816VA19_9BILA|nr:unnamed protein product [Rotaria magnacalcarata]CAF2103502.1 unnamed protein product [Rotaria magnacalcarata]CAF2124481.1 unnamed protein product [Rotaria magnacalcarata]CAF2248904.1 unnamed protein product [Rotaria magnacalcarata]CAF3874027.1 unnamed protein product [Rotaria magnacalcarata]